MKKLKLAVIGKDVSKSSSPSMHTFIANKLGRDIEYANISIAPEEFSSRAESLFREYDGFNVTIPFKLDHNSIPQLARRRRTGSSAR